MNLEYEWEGWNLIEYMAVFSGTMLELDYVYNQSGIRIAKINNNTEVTEYVVDGSRVLYESNGTNTFYYTYDVDGSLISFNYNGTDYFYVYDAFGIILFQTTGTLASANPYRYRGYRYDEETKLYYLNSRYYNPQTGRFLNADGLLQGSQTTLGFNLFAYVENNPVVNIDPSGYCTTQDPNDDGIFQENENPLCGGKAQGQGTPQGDVKMFRGGNDFTPKPGEVKIDKATNNVDPARGGVSVNTNPSHSTVIYHGGPYRIDFLPPGLGYRAFPTPGNPGHHWIIPTNQMTFDQYVSLLHQIKSSIFGG